MDKYLGREYITIFLGSRAYRLLNHTPSLRTGLYKNLRRMEYTQAVGIPSLSRALSPPSPQSHADYGVRFNKSSTLRLFTRIYCL